LKEHEVIAKLTTRLVLTLLVAAATTAGCAPGRADAPPPEATEELKLDVQSIAVLGDSISLGVGACDEPGPCSKASWVDGEGSTESVAARLTAANGAEPAVLNASRAGARLGDLSGTIEDVVRADPDLVVVLAGANDVCTSSVGTVSSEAKFRADASSLLGELRAGLPGAAVVVVSIPDVHGLWNTLHTDPAAVQTWKDARICRSLLHDATSTSADDVERRERLAAHLETLNAALEQECRAVDGCTYDGGRLHSLGFTEDQVSQIDYFHPSAAGQAAIAEVVWRAIVEAETT
jgi:lysophospholipase L1-like esterase